MWSSVDAVSALPAFGWSSRQGRENTSAVRNEGRLEWPSHRWSAVWQSYDYGTGKTGSLTDSWGWIGGNRWHINSSGAQWSPETWNSSWQGWHWKAASRADSRRAGGWDSSTWQGTGRCTAAWTSSQQRGASAPPESRHGGGTAALRSMSESRGTARLQAKPHDASDTNVDLGVIAVSIPEEDREFLRKVNALAAELGTSAFGDAGMPNPSKAQRVLRFVQRGLRAWPEFGLSSESTARGFQEVDPDCDFWSNGRKRFLSVLQEYFRYISIPKLAQSVKFSLLSELGFILLEGFVTEDEEERLLDFWRPNGEEFRKGQNEQHSNRRFFHYGPILPKQSFATTRSTLITIPAQVGATPDLVNELDLRGRIRSVAEGFGDQSLVFDQLYVNFYSAIAKGRIGFHHDNVGTMGGVVAGISLKSSCEFHLQALDSELVCQRSIVVDLPARSLYLMTGLGRYHLQHGIPNHGTDRISMTFRTVVREACGSRAEWRRAWTDIPPAEAAKCHWPLLPPEDA